MYICTTRRTTHLFPDTYEKPPHPDGSDFFFRKQTAAFEARMATESAAVGFAGGMLLLARVFSRCCRSGIRSAAGAAGKREASIISYQTLDNGRPFGRETL